MRLVSAAVPQVKELRKNFQLPQATPEALLSFFVADWEKGNCEKFLPPRLFRSLVQVRGSSSIQQESRVQASDPEGSALTTFRVATSSNPRITSQIAWRQRPGLVGPSVRVLGKPSLKTVRSGSASDWQDLEECTCKHLKSSKEWYEKALATKKLT